MPAVRMRQGGRYHSRIHAGKGCRDQMPMTQELQRRVLGRTGLEVTQLGFGAMELRGAPHGPQ